ncbi:MAG: hypothetical protein HC904_11575 [Blastochloris sp.]|nr:hypothetical protein [Blastochloris sp.]
MSQNKIFQHLREFLEDLHPTTRERGLKYARQGRVQSLSKANHGLLYRARIFGTQPYDTQLEYHGDIWISTCTCPIGHECKHSAALAYRILELNTIQSRNQSKAHTFKQYLPPKPSMVLQKQVQALDQIWREYQEGNHTVTGRSMRAVFSSWPDPSYETYDVFPDKPLTPTQLWHLLLNFARKHGVKSAPDLGPLNDISPSLSLIGEIQHEQDVQHWNQALLRAGQKNHLHESKQPLSLRLKIDAENGAITPQFFNKKKESFTNLTQTIKYQILHSGILQFQTRDALDSMIFHYLKMEDQSYMYPKVGNLLNPSLAQSLKQMIDLDAGSGHIVNAQEEVLRLSPNPHHWKWIGTTPDSRSFLLTLAPGSDDDASPPISGPVFYLNSDPALCITATAIHPAPAPLPLPNLIQLPLSIPQTSILNENGLHGLTQLGCPPPPEISDQVKILRPKLHVQMRLHESLGSSLCRLEFRGLSDQDQTEIAHYQNTVWQIRPKSIKAQKKNSKELLVNDLKLLEEGTQWLNNWEGWNSNSNQSWYRLVPKSFPYDFTEWMLNKPDHVVVECDQELASLLKAPQTGTWKVTLEPSGVDWFDLSSNLSIDDTELSPQELKLLLDADGGFVRIKGKGWKRLLLEKEGPALSQLREIGLDPFLEAGAKQRLHTLQLADASILELGEEEVRESIQRRARELRNFRPPPLPNTIQADLRSYQMEGFHFLTMLSHCHLGGILADDMGLGKTLQTLAWLAWLRLEKNPKALPSLVCCPKSVMDNWTAEAARFYPALRVIRAQTKDPEALKKQLPNTDLVVVNYAQLRLMEDLLAPRSWLACILDEGQFIKNPESQTAVVARKLQAEHRLVLTGTPIENRLLDLWSLLHYAQPGALPHRASFQRQFNEKTNPQARQTLGRRVRPFLLRRNKSQVAKDLPDRIEEDLYCELEGSQKTLYQAHLKEARQILLKMKTERDLDKARFNILTSLLRLRQVCCHPALLKKNSKLSAPSAKIEAMFDVLEP